MGDVDTSYVCLRFGDTVRRLLVTGGAGFIGSRVALAADDAGWQVAVLDNMSRGNRIVAPLLHGDIRDREQTMRLVKEFKPDAVSHHAALTDVSASVADPFADTETNLLGSLNVLDAAARAGCKKFIFASSGGAVYGEVAPGRRAAETHPTRPLSPYGANKLAFEILLARRAPLSGMRAISLRYSNVYGPGQTSGLIALCLDLAARRKPITVYGRGGTRDYVHVGDVVRANLVALSSRFDRGTVNVCSGEAYGVRSVAALTGCATVEGAARAGDIERSVLDPSRCSRLFGEPTRLGSGIKTMSDQPLPVCDTQ